MGAPLSIRGGEEGEARVGYTCHTNCGGLSPSYFFAEGYPEHQATTLVVIIATLYSYKWIQQKVINAKKNQYTLIE